MKVKVSLKTLQNIAKKRNIEKPEKLKKQELMQKIYGGSPQSSKMDFDLSSKMDTGSSSTLTKSDKSPKNSTFNFTIPIRYRMSELLGQGSFGYVVKAIDNISNDFVAIKMLKNNTNINSFLQEIKILINISKICKHFACILDYGFYNNYYFLTMNYIEGKEMGSFNKNMPLTQENVDFLTKLFKQLIYAVNLLHQNKIVHLDIKPQNIIIDKNESLYLVDLGLACNQNICNTAGTRAFALPSIINKNKISFETSMSADYWSIGSTFLYSVGWLDIFLKYIKLPTNEGIKLLNESGFNNFKQNLLNLNGKFLVKIMDLLTYDDKERINIFKELVLML